MRFAQLRSGLDTEHDFVRLGIFFSLIVDVIRCHQRHIAAARQFNDFFIGKGFFFHTVIHDFKEEVVRTENFKIIVQRFFSRLIVSVKEKAGNLTADTGRESDQSLVILAQKIFIHTRLVIHTRPPGFGNQFAQTLVTGFIFAEQHQVVSLDVRDICGVVKAVGRRNIRFATDDGFHSGFREDTVKFLGTADVSVVGDGDGVHAHFLSHFDQT